MSYLLDWQKLKTVSYVCNYEKLVLIEVKISTIILEIITGKIYMAIF